MNSIIGRSTIATSLICGLVLAGCDAVKDVIEEPVIAPPTATAVLQGTITGLGTRRPIGLQYNGQDTCLDTQAADPASAPRLECKFFGVQGQAASAFTFGSLPVGTPYNIQVTTEPYGRACSIANGTGTVGDPSAAPITITCNQDPDVPRYSVSGTISAAASATPGLKIVLSTEEGVREIAGTGLTDFTFPDAVFNNGSSLPVFGWRVTAVVPSAAEGAPDNNCNVTGGPVAGTGGNIETDGSILVPPTGNLTGVQVTSCAFSVSVRADSASGGPAAMHPSGVTVALRHQGTGEDVQTLDITAFGSGGARSFTDVLSNPDAIYELVVTRQPTGQVCVPGFGSGVPGTTATDAGAVLLLEPSGSAAPGRWVVNRSLRCRALPAAENVLTGAYQQFTPVADGEATPTRNFMAFFEDGTYLAGSHVSSSSSSGVEHGFYTYNAAASTLSFLPYADTSGAGGLSSSGAPGPNWTAVQKTAGPGSQLTAQQGGTSLLFREPQSIAGQMTGAWATDDGRRLWVYNGSSYNGFHAGVNGMGNAQDACFPIEDPVALTGYFTRRGNATTCELLSGTGTIFTLDVPSATTNPRLPLGFTGKWPQASSNADGRPSSPVNYTIVPGSGSEPDRITIQNTLHDGSPVNPPILMRRLTVN